MKEFADDNYKFDENGRKFSKHIESIVGKGEIARDKLVMSNFSFFHSVFKRLVLQTRENQGLFGKGLPFTKQKFSDWSNFKAFADYKINVAEKLKFVLRQAENILGKGEDAGYQHFLLLPQCSQDPSSSGLHKVGVIW